MNGRVWLLFVATTLVPACITRSNLAFDAPIAADETLFVIGISPEDSRVKVAPGYVRDDVFHALQPDGPSSMFAPPELGFVVGKAKPGEVMAITIVSTASTDFVPCQGARTMVFTIPDKRAVYVGHIAWERAGPRLLVPRYFDDPASAAAHVAKQYPSLKAPLENASYRLAPTALVCADQPGVDLTAYRTFAFAACADATSPVHEAVRVELEKRNYVYSTESPDLRVKCEFSHDRIERSSDTGSRLGDRATLSGRLVIQLTDTRANAVAWKGTAEGLSLKKGAMQDRAVAADAVERILADVAALCGLPPPSAPSILSHPISSAPPSPGRCSFQAK